MIFTVREPRRVSLSLTRHYDKTVYLLPDTPHTRGLIGKHIEVYEYPDGRIDRRANRAVLAYTICEQLPEIGQGAIVDNKRLGHVLKIAHLVQGTENVVSPQQAIPSLPLTDLQMPLA